MEEAFGKNLSIREFYLSPYIDLVIPSFTWANLDGNAFAVTIDETYE